MSTSIRFWLSFIIGSVIRNTRDEIEVIDQLDSLIDEESIDIEIEIIESDASLAIQCITRVFNDTNILKPFFKVFYIIVINKAFDYTLCNMHDDFFD